MSPKDAAREIFKELDDLASLTDLQSFCPFCGGRLQDHPSRDYTHHPACAWLSRGKIVAALETAERVVARTGGIHRITTVMADDFDALAAALKGAVVPQEPEKAST